MFHRAFAAWVPVIALAACGGVPDSTRLADLTDADAQSLCEEFAGTGRSVTCKFTGGSATIDIGFGTVEECSTETAGNVPAACIATVGDFRSCQDAWLALTDEEICNMTELFPSECAAFLDESCFGTTM